MKPLDLFVSMILKRSSPGDAQYQTLFVRRLDITLVLHLSWSGSPVFRYRMSSEGFIMFAVNINCYYMLWNTTKTQPKPKLWMGYNQTLTHTNNAPPHAYTGYNIYWRNWNVGLVETIITRRHTHIFLYWSNIYTNEMTTIFVKTDLYCLHLLSLQPDITLYTKKTSQNCCNICVL